MVVKWTFPEQQQKTTIGHLDVLSGLSKSGSQGHCFWCNAIASGSFDVTKIPSRFFNGSLFLMWSIRKNLNRNFRKKKFPGLPLLFQFHLHQWDLGKVHFVGNTKQHFMAIGLAHLNVHSHTYFYFSCECCLCGFVFRQTFARDCHGFKPLLERADEVQIRSKPVDAWRMK